MDKYLPQLLLANQRGSYGLSTIDKLKQQGKLQKEIEKQKAEGTLEKLKVYNESTPMRQKISAAVIKAGKSAFKQQVKLGDKKLEDLKNKVIRLEQEGASQDAINKANQDVADYLFKQQKAIDNEAELEKLKNEPLKYLAKLQELNAEQTTGATISTLLLKEIRDLIQAQLTPAQLLQADAEFQTLSSKEKATLLSELTKSTKRDVGTRKQVVLEYLKKTPAEKKILIETLKATVPLKLKGKELTQKQQEKLAKQLEEASQTALPADDDDEEEVSADVFHKLAEDVFKRSLFSDKDEARYVSVELPKLIDQGIQNKAAIDEPIVETLIERLKANYQEELFFRNQTAIQNAADEQARQEALVEQAEAQATQDAAIDNAVQEIVPQFNHPADAPVVQALKEEFEVNDDLKPEEAQADAEDAVGAVNAELNVALIKKQEQQAAPAAAAEPEEKSIAEFFEEKPKKEKKEKKPKKPKKEKKEERERAEGDDEGEGFKPLSSFPRDAVASGLHKHIKRVRLNRMKAKINSHEIMKDIDNQEYRKGLVQNVLRTGKLF